MTNWKYTKGSEKDFEGAPDWACFFVKYDGNEVFVDKDDGKYFYNYGKYHNTGKQYSGTFISYPWSSGVVEIIAQREPVAEWEGRGLPPVGAECEMQSDYGKWIPVDIIANHDGFSFGWSYDLRMVYFSNKAIDFRPIKSESERRRDEAVNAMIQNKNNHIAGENYYHSIYDAIAAGKIPHVKLED